MCNALAMPDTDVALIGSREACRLLGEINRSTLIRWVRAGVLQPVAKLDGANGAYMFARADVEKLARERSAA
jgi:predicted site-specific integrase-resolvase